MQSTKSYDGTMTTDTGTLFQGFSMYQKLVCVCTKLNQVPNDLCTSSTKIRLAARSMGNASDS